MERTLNKTLISMFGIFAIAMSPVPALAQEQTTEASFTEEMASAIRLGVFDIGVPQSDNYWAFWSGEGEPIEMRFADNPDAIREGRWETYLRTGKGLSHEAIGNDYIAGLVAYGIMKDPHDPTKRWIKIIADQEFVWVQLRHGFKPDARLVELPLYDEGSLIQQTVELAETGAGRRQAINLRRQPPMMRVTGPVMAWRK